MINLFWAPPFALAQVQSFNSYLCSTLHVAHAHRLRPQGWTDDPNAMEAMRRKVPQSVAACFEYVERDLFLGPRAMGDTYTVCDPYLFTVSQWMEADSIDPRRFSKLLEHRHRVMERPAVQERLTQRRAERDHGWRSFGRRKRGKHPAFNVNFGTGCVKAELKFSGGHKSVLWVPDRYVIVDIHRASPGLVALEPKRSLFRREAMALRADLAWTSRYDLALCPAFQ